VHLLRFFLVLSPQRHARSFETHKKIQPFAKNNFSLFLFLVFFLFIERTNMDAFEEATEDVYPACPICQGPMCDGQKYSLSKMPIGLGEVKM